MTVGIVTDSTSYLPASDREDHDIAVVTLAVNFGSDSYAEDGLDSRWFYERMAAEREVPTSSQPSVNDLIAAFEHHLSADRDVCGVFLSSDMSGTFSTSALARDLVLERYPDRQIELVDSRSNCMQLGFAVLAAARAAEAGATVAEVAQEARATIPCTRFLFVPHTLDYLRKGGRIGGASALLGMLLQIRPILTVAEGKTDVFAKVRTKKRALEHITAMAVADAERAGGLEDLVVHHIDDEAEGRELAALLEQATGREIPIYPIGAVIGLHVGPGTVGAVYRTADAL
ncbi:MAG: DegV family protein [Coriobacteriia bacterium]|jgi:DegV family protein with EDD domain|nr:DegV family protein [Coriobacteriia bacterium]